MAPTTLKEVPLSGFPQLENFAQVYDSVFVRLIGKVDRILAESRLPQCSYTDLWDVNQGIQCAEQGTVSDLCERTTLCAKHFEAVNR